MPRVRLIHWKAREAAGLLDALRAAGHDVEYDEQVDSEGFRGIRRHPPNVFVIDLSRLPSHGREVATGLRGLKATRHIPIVFLGGAPEKVEAIRKLLPDAVYAPAERLRSALREALANRPASPVVPAQMMDRYSSRTAAEKFGIRGGSTVGVIDPPRNYAGAIGALPAGAVIDEASEGSCEITLWFVQDAADCRESLPAMRTVAASSRLWILWRKGSAITQRFLRESAAAVGLVDYKICAVDGTWSAMLFARRKGV